jgi:multicomponent Na+:H+ antiporter subunit D
MNPLIAAVIAILANLVAAVVAWNTTRGEARSATLTGAAVTVGAAGLSAVPLLLEGREVALTLGGLGLRADTLVGTLLLPSGLAIGALALALPRATARPGILAATSVALAGAVLALLADNLLVLVIAELVGTAAVAWALLQDHHRAGALYLGAAMGLGLVGAGLAIAQGTLLTSFSAGGPQSFAVALWMLAAALVRLGAAPAHSGLTASLQGAPSASGALLAAPISGVAVLARVVQPAFAEQELSVLIATALLGLAATAALLAIAARDLGRSTAWTVAALNGLVIAGIVEANAHSALGGELLWAALVLSEVGFVLVVSMVTRRLGAVDTRHLHGLQPAAPQLSLLFLLVALTIAGVPGTLEFVAHDVLLNGSSHSGLLGTVLAVVTIAAVGFNALRLYFSVFYGRPQDQQADMDLRGRERLALVLLVGAVLAGGFAPSLIPLVARGALAAGG